MANRNYTRRVTLRLGLASLLGVGVVAQLRKSSSSPAFYNQIKSGFSVQGNSPLWERAAAKNLIYGAGGSYSQLIAESQFADIYAQQCKILVPGNELKWDTLRPSETRYDFTQGDWMSTFAQRHNMQFRGHTLVWDQFLPNWVRETVNSQNAEQILTEHITTVVQHYAGRVHSWDVVNEGVSVSYSDRLDGLQPSLWLNFLGKDYIDLAFRTAADADPQTMLVYNDRWLDYDTPRDNAQRRAVLNLLEYLKSSGTPVHALGIQAHLDGSETRFNPEKFRRFLSDVASLGLKILITELDVSDQNLTADIPTRDCIVASAYENYLDVVLDEQAVIAVLTWGLSDKYTWLSEYNPRPDDLPVRVLPYDADFNRKLAWNAIARAFDRRPSIS